MPTDWSPIHCSGRRYPNAPYQARMGCLERQPSHWWIWFGVHYDSFWPPDNTTLGMRWNRVESPTGINAQNFWVHTFTPSGGTSGSIQVTTETAVAGDNFRLTFRVQVTGGGRGRAGRWQKVFPGGFPRWDNAYTLELYLDGGGWGAGGAPLTQSIFNGYYTQVAPNVCLP